SSCNGSHELSAPSEHLVEQSGLRVKQRCGMVVVEILADAAISRFVREVCGGTDNPDCGQRLWEMFVARLQERYAFANWGDVVNKCKAYPVECKQWIQIELWATNSHNEGVLGWTRTAFAEANTKYQAEYERAYEEELDRRRRLGAALQAFGASVAPKPT